MVQGIESWSKETVGMVGLGGFCDFVTKNLAKKFWTCPRTVGVVVGCAAVVKPTTPGRGLRDPYATIAWRGSGPARLGLDPVVNAFVSWS